MIFSPEPTVPPNALGHLPDPSTLPKCPIHREIVLLVHARPELADIVEFHTIENYDDWTKDFILRLLRRKAGIRPIKRRWLPFMGD